MMYEGNIVIWKIEIEMYNCNWVLNNNNNDINQDNNLLTKINIFIYDDK